VPHPLENPDLGLERKRGATTSCAQINMEADQTIASDQINKTRIGEALYLTVCKGVYFSTDRRPGSQVFLPSKPPDSPEEFRNVKPALFSVLLIAGCLVVYGVGIRRRPIKRPQSPRSWRGDSTHPSCR
jgi:hypothetical protein